MTLYKFLKNRNKIYVWTFLLVVCYGLIFLSAYIPNLIQEKYFNQEIKVKILIKSINSINKIYLQSTPSEKKDIENSLKNLTETLTKESQSQCNK